MRHDRWFECERLLTRRFVEVPASRPSRDSDGWRVGVWIPDGHAAHRFPPLSFVFCFCYDRRCAGSLCDCRVAFEGPT
jgi:hypothetical protein